METVRRIVVSVFLGFLLLATPASGQSLSIAQVMTPAEMRSAGINTLTAPQRAALDQWLNDYTLRIVQLAMGGSSAPSAGPSGYAGVGTGHWVKKVSSAGRTVELEDGSVWEINAIDRIYTALWLPVSNIAVVTAKTPIGDYKYTLINKDDGETASARYLGK